MISDQSLTLLVNNAGEKGAWEKKAMYVLRAGGRGMSKILLWGNVLFG